MPKHIYDGTDIAKNPANAALIGTGPFKFAEHKPGEFYLLTSATRTTGTRSSPISTRSSIQVLPDRAAAGNALEAGQIQLAAFSAVPLADLDRIGKVPGLKVYANGYEGADLPARWSRSTTAQGARRPARAAGARARHRPRLRGEDDLPRLCQGVDRPGPAVRQDLLHRRRAAPCDSIRPRRTRCSTRPAIKKGADGMRFKLRLLPAPFFNETKQFGDYLRQALAAIGIDAEIVANDTPRPHQGGLHRPRLRHHRRPAGLSRRPGHLDHHPVTRAGCRPACRSPTSTATPTRRSTS